MACTTCRTPFRPEAVFQRLWNPPALPSKMDREVEQTCGEHVPAAFYAPMMRRYYGGMDTDVRQAWLKKTYQARLTLFLSSVV